MVRQEMLTEFCWKESLESCHLEDGEGNGKEKLEKINLEGYKLAAYVLRTVGNLY
jgi:hypothetical protein